VQIRGVGKAQTTSNQNSSIVGRGKPEEIRQVESEKRKKEEVGVSYWR